MKKTLLDEAKDTIAQKHGFKDWNEVTGKCETITKYLICDEAAKLLETQFASDDQVKPKFTDDDIEKMADEFLPGIFDLDSFKPKEIDLMKQAWWQGATVMQNKLKPQVVDIEHNKVWLYAKLNTLKFWIDTGQVIVAKSRAQDDLLTLYNQIEIEAKKIGTTASMPNNK